MPSPLEGTMPQFKIGDRVERVGALVPDYMRRGIVVRVIPNKDGGDVFTEYQVNFNDTVIATFYGTQLRLVQSHQNSGSGLDRFTA
jgi:hypothetical protein